MNVKKDNGFRKVKLLFEIHPECIKEWDWKRNKDIDPYTITMGDSRSFWWICSNGHSYKRSLKNKFYTKDDKSGKYITLECPACKKIRKIQKTCFAEALSKNPDLDSEYVYEQNPPPETLSYNSNELVWWKCKKCELVYQSSPHSKIVKHAACPRCIRFTIPEKGQSFADLCPEAMKEWDWEANSAKGLDPYKIGITSRVKASFVCANGHKYEMSICIKAKGRICPICVPQTINVSFQEKTVSYYLHKAFPTETILENVRPEFLKANAKKKEYDIYFPERKIAVEYDGGYFHNYRHQADKEKDLLSAQNGITLFRLRDNKCIPVNSTSIEIFIKGNINRAKDFPVLVDAVRDVAEKISQVIGIKAIPIVEKPEDTVEIERSIRNTWVNQTFAAKFPEYVKDFARDKNTVTPENLYAFSKMKVVWICEHGHYTTDTVNDHIRKARRRKDWCAYCGRKSIIKGVTDLQTVRPDILPYWADKDKKPDHILPESHLRAKFTCPDCGNEWTETLASLSKRHGKAICWKCSGMNSPRERKSVQNSA